MNYTRVYLAVSVLALFLNLPTAKAEIYFSELPLEDRVGQLFLVGLPGTELTKDDLKQLKRIRPGGIILFARNIKTLRQVSMLNEQLQKESILNTKVPLLIALDQEGGRVIRVKTDPTMPSPLALGKTADTALVEELSNETGKLIRSLGFNMNLAPVLDILPVSGSSFVGDRAFGTNSDTVTKMGLAFALGQMRARVIPTAKHFPGGGHTKIDPHVQSVVEEGALESVDSPELQPFKIYADLFPSAIMLSHIAYPGLDKSRTPATFSKTITTNLLRKKWGYDGLVITDDLLMAAAKAQHTVKDAVVASFKAGADMFMITWSRPNQVMAYDTLLKAVKSGKISVVDLNTRVRRILRAKDAVSLKKERRHPSDDGSQFESQKLKELDHRVLEKNLGTEIKRMAPDIVQSDMIVVSSISLFQKDFKKLFKGNAEMISVNEENTSMREVIRAAKENPEKRFVITVPNKKFAAQVNTLPKSIKKRCLVVELSSTGSLSEHNYLGLLRLYHNHASLGEQLAQSFNGLLP